MDRPATASMPFLARLAPSARGATPSVRAALPARFAPGEIQGAVAAPVTETAVENGTFAVKPDGIQSLAVIAAATARSATESMSAHGAMRSLSAQPDPALRATAMHHWPAAEAPAESLQIATRMGTVSQGVWPQDRTLLRNHLAEPGLPEPGPLNPTSEAATAVQHANAITPYPAASEALQHAASRFFVDRTRHAPEIRPPLRESTVAQRAAPPRTAMAPVVHVTIDRIDVRVPSPVATVQPSSPAKRAASTLPLDEYLRQRGKPHNGGAQ